MKVTYKPFLLVFLFSCFFLSAQNEHEDIIMKGAEAYAKATEGSKWDKIMELTYPEIIKAKGGERRMQMQAKLSDQQMEQQGFKVKAAELSKPLNEVFSGNHLMCLIPIRLTFEGPFGELYSESSLLAVSKDKGKSWKYISMAQVDFEDILALFPDLNPELKFPKSRIYQK